MSRLTMPPADINIFNSTPSSQRQGPCRCASRGLDLSSLWNLYSDKLFISSVSQSNLCPSKLLRASLHDPGQITANQIVASKTQSAENSVTWLVAYIAKVANVRKIVLCRSLHMWGVVLKKFESEELTRNQTSVVETGFHVTLPFCQ